MSPATVLLLICAVLSWTAQAMRQDRLARLRQDTVDMFYHGFSNYMNHAFPEDELMSFVKLRPLTCAPLTRDRDNPAHIGLNDALGNYSLTLIDSLSTLAILAGGPEDGSYTGSQALSDFQDGVAQFVRHYGDGRPGVSGQGLRAFGFDLDSKVQVFETVIRGLGGLLSAHLFAIGELPIAGYNVQQTGVNEAGDPLELVPISWQNGFKYDGQLLRLALDLGQRLLPAFYTDTGIPYPRVNLRHGIPFYTNSPLHRDASDDEPPEVVSEEITETCSAGAGSLTLEFTVLSRLSGDPRFELAAKRAFWAVWGRRSEIGLIGNGIDAERGQWIGPHAGIGAGMDSFFEYALKSHILLAGHDMPNASTSHRQSSTGWLDPNSIHPPLPTELQSSDAFLEAWHQAHAAVKRYLYTDRSHHPYYSNNHRATGQPYTMWIDSLGAFYPGLLAMAGEVDEAIEANLVYTALWTRYAALPERWSVRENNVDQGLGWWPGRPEFIESTYYIYRATKDPWYLYVGEMVLKDIERRCYVPCGWAGLQDVRTGEKSDRMESFFLGETTKYMYLLFDPDHALNKVDAAYVFSTEGHPLIIPKQRSQSNPAIRRPVTKHDVTVYKYYDENYTNSCPVSPIAGLTGSATAARQDLFNVARFVDLHNTPNIHGPLETIELIDKTKGRVTRYKAKTNYTLFPWTLPQTMLPPNGTCIAPVERVMSWIEFPASDAASSLVSRFGTSLVWYTHNGPTVRNLEGMRFQLERQQDGELPDQIWRITHAASRELGRHENVFFHAEHVRHFKDEAFTCIRRKDVVEINLLRGAPNKQNTSAPAPADGVNASSEAVASSAPIASESLLKSLLRAVSSVFEPTYTDLPESESEPGPTILRWSAYTATGPGAFPMPAIVDTPVTGSPNFNSRNPVVNFPWKTVFLAGQACDVTLPESASRQHQVIVMRRGGCSFSEKLERVPTFSLGPDSLQIVIVVDEGHADDDDSQDGPDDMVRPLLTLGQLTPKGMERLHGIPMVLMRGAHGDYGRFGEAQGVGMRRKKNDPKSGQGHNGRFKLKNKTDYERLGISSRIPMSASPRDTHYEFVDVDLWPGIE
ncbi:mannosyl-oligosaccharide alpha-12-mannosidase [Fusarium albosuccineum]|uniref:alpha-1,2-Mannosidase n=1 Tax=Fusarium albosuccineum TaxID=1237068 RepID=A0A8H4K931_9HYPO|nr:mannosyl-oligosaccharide alpha-12-mannosidase [Fusarium albosuccineum]